MTDFSKVFAAFKDPKTGKLYTGNSHNGIFDGLGDVEVKRRMLAALTAQNDNLGFADEDGTFLTRAQTQEKYGFCQSYQLIDKRSE